MNRDTNREICFENVSFSIFTVTNLKLLVLALNKPLHQFHFLFKNLQSDPITIKSALLRKKKSC